LRSPSTRDRRLLARLEQARLRAAAGGGTGGFENAGASALYAQAFRDGGWDLLRMTPREAAGRFRAQPIFARILPALDDWAFLTPDDRVRKHLRAVARAEGMAEAPATGAVHLEGAPALALEGVARDDPIDPGGETVYDMRLLNQGSAPASGVRLVARLPPAQRQLIHPKQKHQHVPRQQPGRPEQSTHQDDSVLRWLDLRLSRLIPARLRPLFRLIGLRADQRDRREGFANRVGSLGRRP